MEVTSTWMEQWLPGGIRALGGDCSSVADQLRGVTDIYHTASAFAALLKNGMLMTWGNKERGDSVAKPKTKPKPKSQKTSRVKATQMDG